MTRGPDRFDQMLNKTLGLTLGLVMAIFVSGCGTPGEKITDFSSRSLGYGWLNIDDVDANRLHSIIVYQYAPKNAKPYFHTAIQKFKGGYLFHSFGLQNGAFGAYSATGQYCLGLCSNTVYKYTFGKQGADVARVRISQPGVYAFGSYNLKEIDTGFFGAGKFEAVPAENAPTDKEMLREILKKASGIPVMEQRIRAALSNQ